MYHLVVALLTVSMTGLVACAARHDELTAHHMVTARIVAK